MGGGNQPRIVGDPTLSNNPLMIGGPRGPGMGGMGGGVQGNLVGPNSSIFNPNGGFGQGGGLGGSQPPFTNPDLGGFY